MLWTAFRLAVRCLLKAPLFTTVTLITLAVGIGANTAIFSIVYGVLLKPLPFTDPERLVGVWHKAPGTGFENLNQSPATYFTYRDHSRTFQDIGIYRWDSVSITGRGDPRTPARAVRHRRHVAHRRGTTAERPPLHEGGCVARRAAARNPHLRLLAAAVRRP